MHSPTLIAKTFYRIMMAKEYIKTEAGKKRPQNYGL